MSQRSELVGIQYLRGFCAIAVVIDHTSGLAGSGKYLGREVLNGALENGRVGVDIFFVISGFIITVVALDGGHLNPALSLISFFKKRFARIVPLMWLAIASHFLLRLAVHSPELLPINYVHATLLLPVGVVEPSPIWTLRHEMLFYILFAIAFLARKRSHWILWTWCGAPFVYAIYAGAILQGRDEISPLGILFSPVNIEFGAGVAVGLVWLQAWGKKAISSPLNPYLLIAILTLGTIVLSALFPPPWLSAPNALFTGAVSAALIWISAKLVAPTGVISYIGRLIGNSSYAVYLFHMHVVAILLGLASRYGTRLPLGAIIAFVCISAILSGIGIHLLLEKPLVRYAQRLLGPRRAKSPLAATDP